MSYATATTDFFVTDAPDSDDYFPDVDNLLDDMASEDTDPKSSATAAAAVPYVFLLFLLEVLSQFFALVSVLHMSGSTLFMQPVLLSALDMFGCNSYMKMLFTFSL